MDYKAIINLMKEMNQTQLTKLEVESDGIRICMEKETSALAAGTASQSAGIERQRPVSALQLSDTLQPAVALQHSGVLQPSDTLQPSGAQQTGNQQSSADNSGYKQLLSPMVGTFYAQSSPEKPPFVKVGDTVKKGQTICIIEAMKLMNEIESEYDGVIVEVLVDNEDMVEFGQPLFLLK